jgi:putative hydrolase of the HAD superfamily
MLRAVVFDLDDTLFPERAYVLSGFRAVALWCEDKFEIPVRRAFEDMCKLLDSGMRGNTFNRFCEAHGKPEGAVPEMVRVYREHLPDLAPYEGVPELLKRLADRYLLGLVSDGHDDVQQKKLTALGIGPLFDSVVFSDELDRDHWKPSTRPFEIVSERLGVQPGQAVYVGENSLKDFLGARRAGMRTIRVREPAGFYTHESPPTAEHAADLEIDSLADLEEALKEPS